MTTNDQDVTKLNKPSFLNQTGAPINKIKIKQPTENQTTIKEPSDKSRTKL